ncbi:hypothetical protein [Pseudomonas sp.]|uniref:hypothetical protein n=1 Tax=Pseudomonas sp. TaxID=306 RepID=UPI004054036B
MSRPMTDTPANTTLRVRRHRRKKALLSSIQQLISKRGDDTALDRLEAAMALIEAQEEGADK